MTALASDRIQSAYQASNKICDAVPTQGNPLSELYIQTFWSGTDDNEIARKVLFWIPDDLTGTLLDVPAGTAVFTLEKWKKLSSSKIICLDYSRDMLEQAKTRLSDCEHISFIPASNEPSGQASQRDACGMLVYLATAARVKYPAPWGVQTKNKLGHAP